MKRMFWMAASAACLFGFTETASAEPFPESPPVSVRLVDDIGSPSSLSFTLTGPYTVRGTALTLPPGVYTAVESGGTVSLKQGGTTLVSTPSPTLDPLSYDKTHTIKTGRYAYLGSLTFAAEGAGTIRPINTLGLEEYLMGVVPYEVSNNWPIESQKAQAVSARTYALKRGTAGIDNTIKYQVYRGYTPSHRTSIRAVEETRGVTVQYGGRYADTFYSSTNGGTSSSVQNSWGTPLSSYPYLVKQQDPYSLRAGQHLNWSFSVQQTQIPTASLDLSNPAIWWNAVTERDASLMTTLKSQITPTGSSLKILSVDHLSFTVEPYSPTTHLQGAFTVTYMEKSTSGYQKVTKTFTKPTDTLRAYFGQSVLKSPNVSSVSFNGTAFTVRGSGFGHGIGMSQWGAYQMAMEGKRYQDILSFYYPGTTLEGAAGPSVQNLSAVANEADNRLTISGAVEKGSNLQAYVKDNGSEIPVGPFLYANGSFQFPADAYLLPAGNYSLLLRAWDSKGNLSLTTIPITLYDLNPPSVSEAAATVDGRNVTLSYFLSKAANAIVEVYHNGRYMESLFHPASPAGANTLNWTAPDYGIYTFRVVARDPGGRTGENHVTKELIDPSPPSLLATGHRLEEDRLTLFFSTNKTAAVNIAVYQGERLVSVLMNQWLSPGPQSVSWMVNETGPLTYHVRMNDGFGGEARWSGGFTLDTPPPAAADFTYQAEGKNLLFRYSTNKHTAVHASVYQYGRLVQVLSNRSLPRGEHDERWIAPAYGTYQIRLHVTDFQGRSTILTKDVSIEAPLTQPGAVYHTVQPGETLWSISRRYQMDAGHLQRINGLTVSALYAGQRLLVGETAQSPLPVRSHIVQRGETLWSISQKHGVSVRYLQDKNNLPAQALYVGQSLLI